MKQILLIAMAMVFILVSCKTNKSIVNKPVQQGSAEDYQEFCESITFTDRPFTEIESDYYQVDSVFITENCLNIWVSYSGGCGDSEFTLFFNNLVMESMPPKANLMLKLSDKDNCRAIVEHKLTYNINFFDNYANNEGIQLRLAGIGKTVLYKH